MVTPLSPYLRLIQRTGGTRHPGGLVATDILLKRIEFNDSMRLLDVGCGAGHTAAHIAKTYGCQVVGVDISKEAIEKAHDIYKREPYFELMSFLVGDAQHLDFKDASFDVVLCESVLIFIEDKKAAIKEMARVIKPGGYMAMNELCLSGIATSEMTRTYFSRSEMGGFLEPAHVFSDCLKNWRMVVMDEQPFDIKAQLLADWGQWGNFRGLIQLLEAGFSLLTDKQLQSDMVAVLKLLGETPRDILSHLNVLLMLAQKS